ncbi:MAG: glycoside hydrolase family 36 N-terminal domain-containing protein [Limisphaerales bacterium]
MNKTLRASLILPLLFLGHSLFGQAFNLRTKSLTVAFQVGHDGRLYQYPIGLPAGEKLLRDQESYPQAGDGYVWEPALEAVHADGNTSTALLFEGEDQTHEPPDITLTRVHLRDAAYPFHVTLCFRSHYDEDVIEQWAEIRHRERGIVTLQRMASTSLLFSTNVLLTHFFGDWSREMMEPITEGLTPGIKALDSKLGVRADQFENPSFIRSLNGPASETNGGFILRLDR